MKSLTTAYSLEWAFSIISSPIFRTILIVIWVVSLARLLLMLITITRFIQTTVSLLLIAFIPQLFHFFHRLFLVTLHP